MTIRFRAIARTTVLLVLICNTPFKANCGPYSVESIAWHGGPAPGGGIFSYLFEPSVNNRGEVIFSAGTTSDGPTRFWSSALFWGRPGDLHDAGRTLTPAPGTNATFYSAFAGQINDRGELLVHSRIEGTGHHLINDHGVWSGRVENLALNYLTNARAPGTPGSFRSHTYTTLGNGGHVAFWATVFDGESHRILFAGESGNVSPIVLEGVVPGRTDLIWHSAHADYFDPPTMSETGAIGLTGLISSPIDPTAVIASAAVLVEPSGVRVIAGPGTPIPGRNTSFTGAGRVFVNDRGDVAFHGFTDDGVNGLWVGPPANPKRVVAVGTRVPGTTDTRIAQFDRSNIRLSSEEHLAFTAGLEGPDVNTRNGTAMFVATSDSLRLVVRNGDTPPGFDSETTISLHYSVHENEYALNSAGHVAFQGGLFGPNIYPENNEVLYAEDPTGQLTLVIREGYPWQVSPEHVKVVRSFEWDLGSFNGPSVAWNDIHQIALNVSFLDGSSGNFLVTIVPEPSAVMFLIASIGIVSVFWIRRRSRSPRPDK